MKPVPKDKTITSLLQENNDKLDALICSIKRSNRVGFKFSVVMVMIATLAFSLDLIRLGDAKTLIHTFNSKWQLIKEEFNK